MTRPGRAAAACIVLAAVAAHAAPEADRPPPEHVLLAHVADPSDELHGIVARVQAELLALGFEIVLAAPPGSGDLDQLAREAGAVAAVRIGPPGAGIEIYVADPATAQPLVHQVLLGSVGDTATLTLRAVELVRASLLVVAARRANVVAPVRSEPPRSPAPPPRRFAIEAGPAIATSAGSVSTTLHATIAARWRAWPQLELGASALVPTASGTVDARGGRAAITLTAPTAEADVIAHAIGLELRAGIGAGVLVVGMHGMPAQGFVGRDDHVTTALGFARGSVGFAFASWGRIWIDGRIAVTAPRPSIVFAGQPVADWGRPAIIGAVGVEVDVF